MIFKKRITVIIFCLFLTVFLLNADATNDDKEIRHEFLLNEGYELINSYDFEKSNNVQGWKNTNISNGKGIIEVNNGIIKYGGSDYGGYIYRPLTDPYNKSYIFVVKINPERRTSYIWINNKFDKVIIKNRINGSNKWLIEKLEFKCNENIKYNLCIGLIKRPDCREAIIGGKKIFIYDKIYMQIDWIEIWKK